MKNKGTTRYAWMCAAMGAIGGGLLNILACVAAGNAGWAIDPQLAYLAVASMSVSSLFGSMSGLFAGSLVQKWYNVEYEQGD